MSEKEEDEEETFFYPVQPSTPTPLATEPNLGNYENLNEVIDSWDVSSDEIISNDEFINELEKEKEEVKLVIKRLTIYFL